MNWKKQEEKQTVICMDDRLLVFILKGLFCGKERQEITCQGITQSFMGKTKEKIAIAKALYYSAPFQGHSRECSTKLYDLAVSTAVIQSFLSASLLQLTINDCLLFARRRKPNVFRRKPKSSTISDTMSNIRMIFTETDSSLFSFKKYNLSPERMKYLFFQRRFNGVNLLCFQM